MLLVVSTFFPVHIPISGGFISPNGQHAGVEASVVPVKLPYLRTKKDQNTPPDFHLVSLKHNPANTKFEYSQTKTWLNELDLFMNWAPIVVVFNIIGDFFYYCKIIP